MVPISSCGHFGNLEMCGFGFSPAGLGSRLTPTGCHRWAWSPHQFPLGLSTPWAAEFRPLHLHAVLNHAVCIHEYPIISNLSTCIKMYCKVTYPSIMSSIHHWFFLLFSDPKIWGAHSESTGRSRKRSVPTVTLRYEASRLGYGGDGRIEWDSMGTHGFPCWYNYADSIMAIMWASPLSYWMNRWRCNAQTWYIILNFTNEIDK